MSAKAKVTIKMPARRSVPTRLSQTPTPRVKMSAKASGEPSILDSVRDQHGGRWIRFGTGEENLWISVADFTRSEVLARLSNIDPRLVEPAGQRALRSKVGSSTIFRPALLAVSPGWVDDYFVCGDGRVLPPGPDAGEIVVAFNPHPKFAPRGSLEGWNEAVGPIVAGQSLFLFGLALAFVGPLLRFVPADYLSPLFEIVGAPGSGKTTCGVLAMSVWAGDTDSVQGGGETWNVTPGRFDELKLTHRHALLLLDEANLAGASLEQRRQLIQSAVFSLASSGSRQRLGDALSKPHAQLAVLSTSNRRLSELLVGSAAERSAVEERMITIPISGTRPNGVLDTIPPRFNCASETVEALRAAVNEQWGTAGTAFVEKLQRAARGDEERLRTELARVLSLYRSRLSTVTELARMQKSLALVIVAGQLARHWGILPESWGSPAKAVMEVARASLTGESQAVQDPLAKIRSYAQRHREALINVATIKCPLGPSEFARAAGFLRQTDRGLELLVPAIRFQEEFSDYKATMRTLREIDKARTEVGEQAKLTIKTPRSICQGGRVYCILIGRLD